MNSVEPIAAAAIDPRSITAPPDIVAKVSVPEPQNTFGDLLTQGVSHVEHKLQAANDMVRQFALDESVPIHEVTIALEEARIAVDLAIQIRSRLVEAYREIMNTQL
jgi:flagellar hook-basal body complex protein FliE